MYSLVSSLINAAAELSSWERVCLIRASGADIFTMGTKCPLEHLRPPHLVSVQIVCLIALGAVSEPMSEMGPFLRPLVPSRRAPPLLYLLLGGEGEGL